LNLNHILDVAVSAAEKAAEIILTALKTPRVADFKGKTDLVTKTDRDADQIIRELIRAEFPDHGILAEESGSTLPHADFQWIIDPLDGTTNFVHGFPSFAVSIALHYKNEPMICCIIELPVKHVYTAIKDQGAFCNGKKISVSKTDDLIQSLLVTGFGYKHGDLWERNMKLFKHFTDITQGVRRLGAAAVDLCHVASGKVDGFWEFDLHPWDTAAGILIVKEAGGMVTNMDGSTYSIFNNEILATNGLIHQKMVDQLKD
jgi:myo-inositol-1(or 4)-monophosphatase